MPRGDDHLDLVLCLVLKVRPRESVAECLEEHAHLVAREDERVGEEVESLAEELCLLVQV